MGFVMFREKWLTVRLSGVCLSFACVFPLVAGAVAPYTTQSLSLVQGWNAVYVEVAPDAAADDLFADWPVDHVGLYDPASFLATRQFGADWDSEGLTGSSMALWKRGFPEASSLSRVPAGSVLVTYCTNESHSVTIRGVPAAPRTTWHVSGTNAVHNFFGFSTTQQTDISAYLEGSPCEGVKSRAYYRIVGDNLDAGPGLLEVRTWNSKVPDGDVLLLPSDDLSDWSGVLFVSPMNGIDFGQNGVKATLTVRNDGKSPRTVSVALEQAANAAELQLSGTLPLCLHVRDADVARTNAAWSAALSGYGPVTKKELAPDETWRLEFGLDRTAFSSLVKGLSFGALLRITEDGDSHAKVVVPLAGETSGVVVPDAALPVGLWVADVQFDHVLAPGSTVGTETGGAAKLRLPIHIDANGKVRLLQRVVTAGEIAADGTYTYRLYAGSAVVPTTATMVTRISAVCLPTETPVIEAAGESDSVIAFSFAVAADGATSILRHPLHPQHDGLRWDFSTPAPSGDDFQNYKGDVKPETFSVGNRIEMSFGLNGGEAAWNPEDTKSGTCRWTFSGLMRQGNIVLSGPMTVKRVSSVAEIVLE
ncbi:MAG: hypothetical protein II840_12605 [Kiritimatiellae bacterium]|nr:hypothetical protein [Kiritimatiellia bacterium]